MIMTEEAPAIAATIFGIVAIVAMIVYVAFTILKQEKIPDN